LEYSEIGAYDRAIADDSQSIALNAGDPRAYWLRAHAYVKSGQVALALPDADRVLALHSDPINFEFRGSIFEALGRREEAIADYRQALALYPDLQSSKEALRRLDAADVTAPATSVVSPSMKRLFEQMKKIEKQN
jgi:tetratricopeptide (TPR) repeat protein